MENILTILHTNSSHVRDDGIIEEDFYSPQEALIKRIKSLCYLIGTTVGQHPEREVTRNGKLHDLTKSIEKATLDVTYWTMELEKERSDFNKFRRDIEKEWQETRRKKKDIEENLKKILTVRSDEFSSKLLTATVKTEAQKNTLQKEIKLFDFRSGILDSIRCLKMHRLHNQRCDARKRCLDQLAKYDRIIGSLNAYKVALAAERDFIDQEYETIQPQLIHQRVLYRQLQEEYELNREKAFLEKLNEFHRNRAARVIQINWKLYYANVCLKRKRRGRK